MGKNLIVGQSGGPTAVINSSLYGVIQESGKHPEIGTVYGMIHGIEGFLQDRYIDLSKLEALEKLTYTPAAFLGSCRFKLPADLEDPVFAQIFEKLEKLEIGYFLYIGGNDSMDTVSKLSRVAASRGSGIRFIGIPKTVDNDLVGTDHTPGFGSAAKYVGQTVREIVMDARVYDKPSVTVVEVMGRHAGWLTAASILARKGDRNPYLIYLPEVAFDLDRFRTQVEEALGRYRNLVVCISEGIADKDGKFLCEYASARSEVDSFGHKKLTGSARYLADYLAETLGVKVRAVELNVCQRASAALLSGTDQAEAQEAGMCGVRAALEGKTGVMVAFERVSQDPYRMECRLLDVNQVCNLEKGIPEEWITQDGSDVSDAFLDYVLPLIQGKVEVQTGEDGLPDYAYRPRM